MSSGVAWAIDSRSAQSLVRSKRALKIASDAWVFFYMYSILLVLLATAAVGMLIVENFLATAIGAVAFVAVAFVYARLLGRLMWVAAQRDAKHVG